MPPKGTQPKGKQPKASSSSNAPASKPGPALVAPKAITHPEHHHTLNHLHQVAAFYAVLSSTSAASSSSSSDAACRLQGEMVRSAKVLSRKAVIRLDTGVKRGSCPRCDTVWMEGLTVHVRSRVSGPHGHVIKWKCGVCGVLVRRPAPDLVPQFDKAQEKSEKRPSLKLKKTQDPKVKRLAEEKKEGEKQQEKTKTSQRQRRRTASIKRQLLRAAESAVPTQAAAEKDAAAPEASTGPSEASPAAPAPAPAAASEPPATVKLSRGKKRKQRLEKRALRISTGAAPQKRGRRKIPALRPDELRVPPIYTFADQVYYDKGSPRAITVSSTCSTPPPLSPAAAPAANDKRGVPAGKIVRTQRPQLPHFNDRTEHSHWDSPFTALHNHLHPSAAPTAEPSPEQHSATHDPVGAFSCQALQYWEKAARSRGDHRLITGVGKNGALGPTLP